MAYKINDLPSLGRNLSETDLLELSLAGATGSRKVTGKEIVNGSFNLVSAEITHNGNIAAGGTTSYPGYNLLRQYGAFYNNPLIGVSETYVYNVKDYTQFQFLYDNFTYGNPSEVTIDNESVLNASINLSGVGYTVNFNGEFFKDIQSLYGSGKLNFPKCIAMEQFYSNGNPFVELDMPSLEWISGTFSLGGTVKEINLPRLEYAGYLQIQYATFNIPDTTLTLPSLKYIAGQIYLYGVNGITSLDLSELVATRGINIQSCAQLTSINVPSLVTVGFTYNDRFVSVQNCPLDQASVDMILQRIDLGGQYNGTIQLGSICSAPSAAGYIAVSNLVSKGWSVSTN
jgi:hypothetical protein